MNCCLQTVVLEKTHEIPLDSKEIKPVNCKGNQPWIFIGRTDDEAPVFCSYDINSWLTGNIPDAGKDWGQKVKRCQRMRCLDIITDAMNMNFSKLQEMVRDREAWCAVVHEVSRSWTWLGDWTTTKFPFITEINYMAFCPHGYHYLETNVPHSIYSPETMHHLCAVCLVTQLWITLCPPWTAACQAPLSLGILQAQKLSGFPSPPTGDLPNPGVKPRSPTLQADASLSEPAGKPIHHLW